MQVESAILNGWFQGFLVAGCKLSWKRHGHGKSISLCIPKSTIWHGTWSGHT